MESQKIILGEDVVIEFRKINLNDADALGLFFDGLSPETRARYAPHPLTKEHAYILCSQLKYDTSERFILDYDGKIIGYFILDYEMSQHEKERYQKVGINLESQKDVLFAPCIADEYQNKGFSSKAMKLLINYLKEKKVRSLVLLGGTQESNAVARAFYEKFGFKEYGRFETEISNIDMRLEF